MTITIFGEERIVSVMCSCMREAMDKERARDAENERIKRLESMRRFSLMDEAFTGMTFETSAFYPEDQALYRMARNYCDNWKAMKGDNIGMTLQGPPGAGKTHLAFCIANALIFKGVPVMALSTIGLINRIYDSYGKRGDSGEAELIGQLGNAELLVLDDLGAEHTGKSGKDKQIIYSVLDARVRAGKPIIITTNLDTQSLRKHLTSPDGVDRTYDRLIAVAPIIPVIPAPGRQRRREIGKEKHRVLQGLMK